MPRVQEPAPWAAAHLRAGPPLQPGSPVLILSALCICSVSSRASPNAYSGEGRSTGFG